MFDEIPEISPDLEWILLSRQADRQLFLEVLVHDYSHFIYHLFRSVLIDPDLADQASRVFCTRAYHFKSHYKPEDGLETWMVRVALPILKKINRRVPKSGTDKQNKGSFERVLEKLTWKTRLLIALKTWDWSDEQIARALNTQTTTVAHRVEKAHQEILDIPENPYRFEDFFHLLIENQQTIGIEDEKKNQWLQECLTSVKQTSKLSRVPLPIRESFAIGIAITLILLGVWVLNYWFPDPEQNTVAQSQSTLSPEIALERLAEPIRYKVLPGESLTDIANRLHLSVEHLQNLNKIPAGGELQPGQIIYVNLVKTQEKDLEENEKLSLSSSEAQLATGEEPAAEGETNQILPAKLNQDSSPDEIIHQIKNSQLFWENIFIEAQWIDYGPPNYLGPAYQQRIQAWISQPSSSLVKTGFLSGPPLETSLITGAALLVSRVNSEKTISWWEPSTFPLSSSNPIYPLLAPSQVLEQLTDKNWSIKNGERIANRSSILVESYNQDQTRLIRLNIDKETGIILHMQVSEPTRQLPLSELIVTQIKIEKNFQNKQLFDPLRIHQSQFTSDYLYPFPEDWQVSQQAELAIQVAPRTRISFPSAPDGYQSEAGSIRFLYPEDISNSSQGMSDVFVILDDYLWGEIQLGPFWQTACLRSARGNTLAFYSSSGSGQQVTQGIQWLNLLRPQEIYQVMPDFEIYQIAFHPDGLSMVVFAQNINSGEKGLYLLDYATGQSILIFLLEEADHLQWKPDGDYLSVWGREPNQDQAHWMLIHMESGLVTSKLPAISYPAENSNQLMPPANYPGWEWGVNLLDSPEGLGACETP